MPPIHTKESIKAMLLTRDTWVERAVTAIFKLQTDDEKQQGTTRHSNGVGFSAFDAEIMTSFANQILLGQPLSEKQMRIARKKIVKYAGQLEKLANRSR